IPFTYHGSCIDNAISNSLNIFIAFSFLEEKIRLLSLFKNHIIYLYPLNLRRNQNYDISIAIGFFLRKSQITKQSPILNKKGQVALPLL
ncbi:MAG: hypothetical protein DRP96_11250, partial [Candidatus Neomarinimicrobiota bacterium]